MPDILIRGIEADVLKRLKLRAKRNGRSLQGEVKQLIVQGAGASGEEIAAMLDRWQRRFAGRKMASSADLIREDRER